MPLKLVAFSNDPVSAYLAKGEIKENYFNPGGLFDQVHLITPAQEDVSPGEVRSLAGRAELFIHPVGRPGFLSLPFLFKPVTRLVRALRPDLIRAHNAWAAGALAVHAGKKLKIPTLIYLHIENDQRRRFDPALKYRLVKPLERYSLRGAAAAVCVSGFLEAYAARYGARRTVTVYNKVYAAQFARPAPQGFHDPVRVLCVGRLDPQKAPDIILRAVASLDPEQRVELTLIGQGSLKPGLERLASELGIADRVGFIGAVPHAEIQKHYRRADIFALATHYEGFCIPVLEAMAAGLPVLVSDTPPLGEIIGETGLIVDKTPEAFGRALGAWIEDPGPALALGRQAAVRAAELDGKVMEDREVELYKELLAGTRGGRS